jgi:hypothetical protein
MVFRNQRRSTQHPKISHLTIKTEGKQKRLCNLNPSKAAGPGVLIVCSKYMLMKLDDSFQGYIFDLFLYTGETWAVLQSDGTIPVVTDLLNNMVRIGAISTESYFKSFGLISFGPAALDGFKLHKRFCLPSVFTTGIVPSDWRTAHVSPVYKKRSKI